jgi:hypothetical protein
VFATTAPSHLVELKDALHGTTSALNHQSTRDYEARAQQLETEIK